MSIPRTVLRFVSRNAPTILTVSGVVGVVTTALLTGRATVDALEAIRRAENEEQRKLNRTERFKLCWTFYIPPALSAVSATVSIIGANTSMGRRNAALLSLYGAADTALTEYKSKVVEVLGKERADKIQDEIAQDRVRRTPGSEVLLLGTGESLFYDNMSGRYFKGDVESLRGFQNDINSEVINQMYVFLNQFYEKIGLNHISLGDEVGWNNDRMLELEFSAILTEENKPCIAIDYRVTPHPFK